MSDLIRYVRDVVSAPWAKDLATWLWNINNLTFLMAAIGFIYSVYDFFATRLKSRENYEITVIDYAARGGDVLQFLICITNKSSEPLAISKVSVFETSCELMPKAIRGRPDSWNFRHTPDFPICIEGHGCDYAFLEFVAQGLGHNQLVPGVAVSFEIHSTHKQAQKTVTLGQKSHYLHSREQSQETQLPPQERDVCSN